MAEEDGVVGSETEQAWWRVNGAELVLAAPVGGGGVGGGFVVDPERAQECIDKLTRIVADVRRGLVDAGPLQFVAPGLDQVSRNFARNGDVMAARAEEFVRTWVGQIEATRDALQTQVDAYRTVDSATAERLR